MGQPLAVKCCVVMSTIWDARQWSEEKMLLFSKSLADLDYALVSKAIDNLIKSSKWQPTPAEVRAEYDKLLGRIEQRRRIAADRREQRLLAGPEQRDADGKLIALAPIRDCIKTLSDKLAMDQPRGIFAPAAAREALDPQTSAEREERRNVLRRQAERLRHG